MLLTFLTVVLRMTRETMLGRVRLYLCRHAHAAPGDPDELRELTADGRAAARQLAVLLDEQRPAPELVLASPLLRARQTAEAVTEHLGIELHVEPRLAPGATASALLSALASLPVDAVAAVGHQPDCSEIAQALIGRDPGFPPGGMLTLDVSP